LLCREGTTSHRVQGTSNTTIHSGSASSVSRYRLRTVKRFIRIVLMGEGADDNGVCCIVLMGEGADDNGVCCIVLHCVDG